MRGSSERPSSPASAACPPRRLGPGPHYPLGQPVSTPNPSLARPAASHSRKIPAPCLTQPVIGSVLPCRCPHLCLPVTPVTAGRLLATVHLPARSPHRPVGSCLLWSPALYTHLPGSSPPPAGLARPPVTPVSSNAPGWAPRPPGRGVPGALLCLLCLPVHVHLPPSSRTPVSQPGSS